MDCSMLRFSRRAGLWLLLPTALVNPFQKISGLAAKDPAHCLQGAKAHGLGSPVLQDGDVRRGQTDPVRELSDAHLASGEFEIYAYYDRHPVITFFVIPGHSGGGVLDQCRSCRPALLPGAVPRLAGL